MSRSIFIIKTIVVCIVLIIIGWIVVTGYSKTDNNTSYIRVIDPSQSQADLQQVKNILHGYLNTSLSQPIGVILRTDKPLFLLPPTLDTGTLRTYIDSIQSLDQGNLGDLDPLIAGYNPNHIFVSSIKMHTYRDIHDFASVDTSVQITDQQGTPGSWKIGILSVLLVVVLLI